MDFKSNKRQGLEDIQQGDKLVLVECACEVKLRLFVGVVYESKCGL